MSSPSPVKTEPTLAEKFSAKKTALATNAVLKTQHRLIHGDARSMREVPDESVHLVVTSPPYWNLKRYNDDAGTDQLGHLSEYAHFQNQLNLVWQRCLDMLVPGGRLCIVVGDVCIARRKTGRHHVVPLHADISVNCRNIGFDYLTPILWYKIANAKTEVEGNGSSFLGKPYEPNAIIKNDVEYILMLRKPGGYRKPSFDQRVLSLIDKDDYSRWFRAIWDDIPGASRTKIHPAPYPVTLASRLIRMFSFVGDVVVDPFLGTGTTTEAAIQSARCSIGYEIDKTYYDLTKQRFAQLSVSSEILFQ